MPKTRSLQLQRKRRVRISKDAPFPVPIATVTGETASNSNWIYYTAALTDGGVTVHHSGDMDFLYRMGFFGKGSLSRGQPLWSEGQRVAALPVLRSQPSGGWHSVFHARVASRRRYMTHLQWHLRSSGDASTLAKAEQDLQVVVEEPRNGTDQEIHNTADAQNPENSENEGRMDIEEEDAESMYPEAQEHTHTNTTDWGEGEGDAEFWGTADDQDTHTSRKAQEKLLDAWENAEGDAEFWGTESADAKPGSPACSRDEAASPCVPPGASETSTSKHTTQDSVHPQPSSSESDLTQSRADTHSLSTPLTDSAPEACVRSPSPTVKDNGASEPCDSIFHQPVKNDNDEQPNSTHPNKTDHAHESADTSDKECAGTASCEAESSVEWSKFCHHNDDDLVSGQGGQLLFVVPDSDEETATADGQICRTKIRWKPVVKVDPCPVKEHLDLSCEEAFFLSYGLGCLTVLDSDKVPMNLEGLWKEFCQRQPDFVPHYIAYHHYRSKNWVPKTGLKFGCTFLLYKDGPPFFHGSYSVVVKFVDAAGNKMAGFGEERHFSWTSLAGLKRITEHVGKELMMCYVVKPLDLTPQDMLNPACIPRFQVKEMVVSRWVSSQERESKALDDLP